MSESADYYSIYEGVWINWAHGRVFGSTITLNRRDGGLLISFITLFITIVGTAFWRILCFTLHHRLSSEAPRDALYHQQQAVLRNSANGASGLCSLVQILWAWSHHKVHRTYQRVLPTVILTIFFLGSFAVAGIFSSKIATSTSTEVLVSSPNCGGQTDSGIDVVSRMMTVHPYMVRKTVEAANYAQKCYSNTSSQEDCRVYVQQQLPWTSNRNATCPFPREMCKNYYNNLELDTGFIDSNEHLGVNAPTDSRVIFRSVHTCAPLAVGEFENKTTIQRDDMEAQRTRFYLGPTLWGSESDEFTLERWDYTSANDSRANGKGFLEDYSIRRMPASFANGSVDPTISDFDPIPQLRNPQADLETYFLSSNNIVYANETNDPWYSAHQKYSQTVSQTGDGQEEYVDLYMADDVASVMGCVQQYQLCNPNLPKEKKCSPLAAMMDNFENAKTLWPEAKKYDALRMPINTLLNFAPAAIAQNLGIASLTSRYSLQGSMQGPLPDNQWQLDLEHWFTGALSLLQSRAVEYATGPSEPAMQKWIIPPKDDAQHYFCDNQKILTTAYTNFNTFGLCLTLVLGGIIIITSYTLETIVSYIQMRHNLDKYSRLEWCANETLQLQRLAHEELGLGTWRGGADPVPTTQAGERLGMLDLGDLKHPRLKAPPTKLEEVVAEEGRGQKVQEKVREVNSS